MIRLLLALLLLAWGAVAPVDTAEATHDGACDGSGIIDLTTHPDRFQFTCDGLGKGWLQAVWICFKVQSDVGTYRTFYGTPVFKAWYEVEALYHRCTSYRPHLAISPGLRPYVLYWHG